MLGLDERIVGFAFLALWGMLVWFVRRMVGTLDRVTTMVREHDTELKLQKAALGFINDSVDDLQSRVERHERRMNGATDS